MDFLTIHSFGEVANEPNLNPENPCNPVRQVKPGFPIDLKCDQHVKEVSNM